MNQPRIHVESQVWHWRANNVVAHFDTAAEALEELTGWVEHGGEIILSDLYISLCKWSPDLDDDEQLELEDDQWVGPGPIMLDFLASMQMSEPPTERPPDSRTADA